MFPNRKEYQEKADYSDKSRDNDYGPQNSFHDLIAQCLTARISLNLRGYYQYIPVASQVEQK
jgi:hypothetical protein